MQYPLVKFIKKICIEGLDSVAITKRSDGAHGGGLSMQKQ